MNSSDYSGENTIGTRTASATVGRNTGSISARFILIVAGVAFLFGALVVGYALNRFGYLDFGGNSAEQAASDPRDGSSRPAIAAPANDANLPLLQRSSENETPVQTVERVVEQQGGIDQRLAAAEQRIARLDLQAQAAGGNAARAEGLLIAFAVRRTLERGEKLGLLRDQLQLRFGAAQPNAVKAVLDLAKRSVTRERLVAGLERLSPQMSGDAEEASLARLQREVGELFTFRRTGSDSPQPEKRLERARLRLTSGQIEQAIAEVERLPGADKAENAAWLADARRFDRAQKALDVLETTAILEPRRLRDAEGGRVQQPSPVEARVGAR